MFTGLVSDVGRVLHAEGDPETLRRYVIETMYSAASVPIGASISCSGICLTAVAVEKDGSGSLITFEAAAETLARTLAGTWKSGTLVNLERSLKVGDELGGHFVTGHVDAVARITERRDITDGSGAWGATAEFQIEVPAEVARFVAVKGSVALDGVSLTVNSVSGCTFSVLLIPHTLGVTTFGNRQTGDRLHIEVDLMARYAARLEETRVMQN